MKNNKRLLITLTASLLVLMLLSPFLVNASWFSSSSKETVTISKEEYERLKQYERLDEVKKYVEAYFYEEPKDEGMMDGAIQGLLSGLGDSYTFYYPTCNGN